MRVMCEADDKYKLSNKNDKAFWVDRRAQRTVSNFDGNFAYRSYFADWLPCMSGNFFEIFFVMYKGKIFLEVIL